MADDLELAAAAIRRGELVGMPTETVYGIAADARNRDAVCAIFALKGRPADNPLIVHLASVEEVGSVAREFTLSARLLAEAFWPGPLTLVLPKQPDIPDETTGGLDTVAVRVPAHPMARGLIRASGLPLAAPSANRFMSLSPTRAEDISPEIAAGLAVVLDGGPCHVGIESTVVDATGAFPRVLRQGHISADQIRAVAGLEESASTERRSPGMYRRHYSPRTPLVVRPKLNPDDAGLTFGSPQNPNQLQVPTDPEGYAQSLYAALHELDRRGVGQIVVESPPVASDWAGIWDRLRRATDH